MRAWMRSTSPARLSALCGCLLTAICVAACGAGGTPTTHVHTTRQAHISGRPADCFVSHGSCGYPDPVIGTVGLGSNACAQLPVFNQANLPLGSYYNGSNLLSITMRGATLQNLRLPPGIAIAVDADNVTVNHVCALINGHGHAGSSALTISKNATGTTVENSTLGGANATDESAERAITNDTNAAGTVADNDQLINCGECVHGTWKLDNSYVDANARIRKEHYEDWYFSDGTISADHDVFVNPHEQTAEIFGDTHGGEGGRADNHVTITDSLLAGGGYMIYPNSTNSGVGSSTMRITGNRFARCTGAARFNKKTGGQACAGGPDRSGFWPQGGYFGVSYPAGTFCTGAGQTWADNSWDDEGGGPVRCQSSEH
jgi:hypothetical protein